MLIRNSGTHKGQRAVAPLPVADYCTATRVEQAVTEGTYTTPRAGNGTSSTKNSV